METASGPDDLMYVEDHPETAHFKQIRVPYSFYFILLLKTSVDQPAEKMPIGVFVMQRTHAAGETNTAFRAGHGLANKKAFRGYQKLSP